jgi:hypothetical protein
MNKVRIDRVLLCAAGASLGAISCAPDRSVMPGRAAPTLSAASSAANVAGAGTLRTTAQVVQWSGTSLRDGPVANEIPECEGIPCDRYDLTINLPAGTWTNAPGGVQVALRWGGIGTGLTLYVYRNGVRVAASEGHVASAQSALVPTPANGTYQVYVAYDFLTPGAFEITPAERIPYEALAEVEYLPKAQPRRALLPDLAARAQRNVMIEVPPAIKLFEAGVPTTSCFPSEIEDEQAKLCMRFDQVLANEGEGPLEIRFQPVEAPAPKQTGPILQRVYNSDGTYAERQGGTWEFHATHSHYHYTGFALSRLYTVDASGKRGAAPVRSRRHRLGQIGALSGTARKVSFCLVDVEIDRWAKKGDAPRGYSADDCLAPKDGYMVQGLSAGWSDVYDWFLPDQYLDVFGLADGLYLLETVADPDNTLQETNETNNCGAVYVRLSGMATARPQSTLVGPAPGCASTK